MDDVKRQRDGSNCGDLMADLLDKVAGQGEGMLSMTEGRGWRSLR